MYTNKEYWNGDENKLKEAFISVLDSNLSNTLHLKTTDGLFRPPIYISQPLIAAIENGFKISQYSERIYEKSHLFHYIYQEWYQLFLTIVNFQNTKSLSHNFATSIPLPLKDYEIQLGLSLFEEINGLNLFPPSECSY